jgi:hypothetical protein
MDPTAFPVAVTAAAVVLVLALALLACAGTFRAPAGAEGLAPVRGLGAPSTAPLPPQPNPRSPPQRHTYHPIPI